MADEDKTTHRLISIGRNAEAKGMVQIVTLTKAQTRHLHGPNKGKFKTIHRSQTRHITLAKARELGIKV